MQNPDFLALRTVRSTAYNNEVAAELLRELAPFIANAELNRRLRCATRQLLRDADALEGAYQQMAAPGH
ncbi:hypothetical protein IB274_05125 [Pseudomonas sp. PDM18]|uniref:hypothetical protein n=1 Tax=Pseudomonas sp. PDM18 TaxID=2769253 RepID=UPI00177CCD10|nr:hypothetical protein [Pseudomonas sp. PDM18]MBD9676072.1 hypothetical protein [Pseudomonas sp. PDM18]